MFKLKKPLINVDITGEPLSMGDWKREKELGSGGFGVVHLWVNKGNGDCLAVKKCKWNHQAQLSKEQQERWIQEVDIMKHIKNENIVAYKELPEDLKKMLIDYSSMNLPVLSMEYCTLGNLRNVIAQVENSCGLREIDVVHVLKDISNALIYLHQLNITHRDVKPENIVLQYCDHRKKPVLYKLIDLGYAKELHNETASFVGTLQYLAPEIFTQQKYNKKVDYWSFGILVFEVICGVRPFLHTFTPWESINYLEKKASNIIALSITHTGDIKSHTGLFNENHLNRCLAEMLEKWLQVVLEYSPEKRGLCSTSVFSSIQEILSKKIITVFSIFNYKFYSYEINESTLISTLQDWIARDTKISVQDQVLVTKNLGTIYAHDYHDEGYSSAMVFVFKQNATFNDTIMSNLPTLIKVLFEDIKTDFKFGTLKQLFAQTLFLLLNESKHIEALKSGICCLKISLENHTDRGNLLYARLNDSIKAYLSEIEFYNYLETSLFSKVYEDINYEHVKDCEVVYRKYMQKLTEVIHLFNDIGSKYKTMTSKFSCIKNSSNDVFHLVDYCDFNILIEEVSENLNQIQVDQSINDFSSVLQLVSKSIKLRDNLLSNSLLIDYLRSACSCWKEVEDLIMALNKLECNFLKIKDELRKTQFFKIKGLKYKSRNNDPTSKIFINGVDLLQDNITIRYRLQELMDAGMAQHKKFIGEINSRIVLE